MCAMEWRVYVHFNQAGFEKTEWGYPSVREINISTERAFPLSSSCGQGWSAEWRGRGGAGSERTCVDLEDVCVDLWGASGSRLEVSGSHQAGL